MKILLAFSALCLLGSLAILVSLFYGATIMFALMALHHIVPAIPALGFWQCVIGFVAGRLLIAPFRSSKNDK